MFHKPYVIMAPPILGSTIDKGFSAPLWMTFRQAKELGAHVTKGEQGSLVVYANTLHKTEIDKNTGEETEHDIPFMKGYTVFNVEQIEGLPESYYALAGAPQITPQERNEELDAFFAQTGANIRHGRTRAYYAVVGQDAIQMPPFETFQAPESYSTPSALNTASTGSE